MDGNARKKWTRLLLKFVADILFCNGLLWLAWSEQILQFYSNKFFLLPFGPWSVWKAFEILERLPAFTLLARLRSERSHYRALWVFLDLCVFNVLGFLLLKTAIFYQGQMTDLSTLFTVILVFAVYMWFAHGIEPWTRKPSLRSLVVQCLGISFVVFSMAKLSGIEATNKGVDFSWLRVEMIKTPYWFQLLVPVSPWYTASFIILAFLLIFLCLTKPKSLLRIALPLTFALSLWAHVNFVFGQFDVPTVQYGYGALLTEIYTFAMAGPAMLATMLLGLKAFNVAFRLFPLVYYTTLVFLNYTGAIPLYEFRDVLPWSERNALARETPGMDVVYPPQGKDTDASFMFLRKLEQIDSSIYTTFGPTCGVYRFDLDSGGLQSAPLPGLVRDTVLSPDKKSLWGLSTQRGDFVSVDTDTLLMRGGQDLHSMDLHLPLRLRLAHGSIYVSNATPPTIARLKFDSEKGPEHSLQKDGAINFQDIGFTPYSDVCAGLHIDADKKRLYTQVGILEDRFLFALVEVDTESFELLRDIRFGGGGQDVFKIRDRNALLIPHYYRAELHEIDLDTMTLTRTMTAGPNLISMEHDEKRGLFYALNRAAGELQIIDDRRGEVVHVTPVGPKCQPLLLNRKTDTLYVGSGWGLIRLDLPTFLAEAGVRAANDSPP